MYIFNNMEWQHTKCFNSVQTYNLCCEGNRLIIIKTNHGEYHAAAEGEKNGLKGIRKNTKNVKNKKCH